MGGEPSFPSLLRPRHSYDAEVDSDAHRTARDAAATAREEALPDRCRFFEAESALKIDEADRLGAEVIALSEEIERNRAAVRPYAELRVRTPNGSPQRLQLTLRALGVNV
jgi:hypothetical protein